HRLWQLRNAHLCSSHKFSQKRNLLSLHRNQLQHLLQAIRVGRHQCLLPLHAPLGERATSTGTNWTRSSRLEWKRVNFVNWLTEIRENSIDGVGDEKRRR
ncbi:hypothetical protein PFISCL1PPCAC_24572, partial [Pristionchus fissidentatus]